VESVAGRACPASGFSGCDFPGWGDVAVVLMLHLRW
jgi:hypothetical protein